VQYGVRTPTGTWGQYTQYWDHLLHGNLGTSLNAYPASVGSLIRAALPSRVLLKLNPPGA
jgi:peptide/nickel transport system permease protein